MVNTSQQVGGSIGTALLIPEEYVAESVVKSLRHKVEGKRVLLVRAKVARDVSDGPTAKEGGDLGYSFRHNMTVTELIGSRLGPTLLLMLTVFALLLDFIVTRIERRLLVWRPRTAETPTFSPPLRKRSSACNPWTSRSRSSAATRGRRRPARRSRWWP